ncbi:hypothetical protein DFH28DRAFT_881457 [Melampsora americana]|nr:hypothetical protein DFH28DRAFT_881457 [Melampsora americana]
MLNRLPVEVQNAIIERILDLDMAQPGNPIYPHDGNFESAHTLRALSEVTFESTEIRPFREVCESFIWRILRCDLEDCEEMANDPDFEPLAKHVRSFTASMRILTDSAPLFTRALEMMDILDRILNKFSDLNLKHIRLYIHAEHIEGVPWVLEDEANVERLQMAHQKIISSLGNFPSLNALDVENCFALMSDDVIARCIEQLPNLVRFRAHENAFNPNIDLTQSPRLGESLASRTKLEQLSLKNLGYPSPAWCDLNWQGPLKDLNMRGCNNLENQALFRFIFNIPSLEKIRLQDHNFKPLDVSAYVHQIPFPNLISFTFLGAGLDPNLVHILVEAPRLERLHLHSSPPRDCLRAMRDSIRQHHEPWARLSSVVLSFIRRTDQERIWLEDWGTEREPEVRVKFHWGFREWNQIGECCDSSDEEGSDDGTPPEDNEQADDHSEAAFEPEDDSEVSEPEDWEVSWKLKSV